MNHMCLIWHQVFGNIDVFIFIRLGSTVLFFHSGHVGHDIGVYPGNNRIAGTLFNHADHLIQLRFSISWSIMQCKLLCVF